MSVLQHGSSPRLRVIASGFLHVRPTEAVDQDAAEVFLNINLKEKTGEFSEKDEGYSQALIQLFTMGLRDGTLKPL